VICESCTADVPDAAMGLHRRVCRAAPKVSPVGDTAAGYQEQVAMRDAVIADLKAQLDTARQRLEKVTADRDQAISLKRTEMSRREYAERKAADALKRLETADFNLNTLRGQLNAAEERLKRKRMNGRGTYPLDEANQRELAKLMVQRPGTTRD
jgi:hypothetical protein